MSEELDDRFARVWEDVFALVMFLVASALALGTLWIGLDPPGGEGSYDTIVKAGLTSIGTVLGAAIMFLKGKR